MSVNLPSNVSGYAWYVFVCLFTHKVNACVRPCACVCVFVCCEDVVGAYECGWAGVWVEIVEKVSLPAVVQQKQTGTDVLRACDIVEWGVSRVRSTETQRKTENTNNVTRRTGGKTHRAIGEPQHTRSIDHARWKTD